MPSQIRPPPPRRTWRSKGASWRSLWKLWEYPCATTEMPTVAHGLPLSFRGGETAPPSGSTMHEKVIGSGRTSRAGKKFCTSGLVAGIVSATRILVEGASSSEEAVGIDGSPGGCQQHVR